MTARVSMNAVVNHCTVVSETSNCSISGVSATFMMVSLRIITKAATSRAPMVNLSAVDSRPSSAERDSGAELDGELDMKGASINPDEYPVTHWALNNGGVVEDSPPLRRRNR